MFSSVVYGHGLRHLLRSRKLIFAAIVSAIPLVLAILAFVESSTWEDTTYHSMTGPGLTYIGLAGTIPLMVLLLAGGTIADETEERTLSYLLVRPIRRRVLFVSRTLAVATVATGLALFQLLSTWLVDAIFFGSYGVGQTVTYAGQEIPAANILWASLGIGMLVVPLAALVYSTMFSAVSVIFTKYQFFANLVWYILWESTLGWIPVGSAWLSANHSLRALSASADPTIEALAAVDGAWGFIGIPIVLLMIAIYGFLGIRVVERRDFHITSAAT